jgi:L-arabinokinase
VVVTKPGYGVITECLANHTAMLYTSRGRFAEYPILLDAFPRFLRSRFISQEDLFAGRWREHLDALLGQAAPPASPRTDGADVAADAILSMLEARST